MDPRLRRLRPGSLRESTTRWRMYKQEQEGTIVYAVVGIFGMDPTKVEEQRRGLEASQRQATPPSERPTLKEITL